MLFQFLCILICLGVIDTQDNVIVVNGKKSINIVSDKFLSISIDPAVLLSGITFSPTTYDLARHLSPAFVRFTGPTTAFVRFSKDDITATKRITETTTEIVVTPSSWKNLQNRVHGVNLTAVYALNNNIRNWDEFGKSSWITQGLTDLLNFARQDRIYWQIGYDCLNQSFADYQADLRTFQNLLENYPEHKDQWSIIGGDISNCINDFSDDSTLIEIIQNKEFRAITFENKVSGTELLDNFGYYLKFASIPIWTSAPKTTSPVSFDSGMLWALQLGRAAEEGFEVIFRQPRLHEMFAETPTFWVSYFHKKFMGRNVIDMKKPVDEDVDVFAHCARNQNTFTKQGAVAFMVVNNASIEGSVSLRIGAFQPTSKATYEVQSYILQPSIGSPSETLLNGQKLSLKMISKYDFAFTPKLRRARVNKHLILNLPANSVGYFIIPGAQLTVCINDEDDDILLKEIHADQHLKLPDEISLIPIATRNQQEASNKHLKDVYQQVEKELETDQQFYKKHLPKLNKERVEIYQKRINKEVGDAPKILDLKIDQKVQDLRNKIKEKLDAKRKSKLNLDLTSSEMVKVLKERAISKIDRSKNLSEDDVEGFVHKAIQLKKREKRATRRNFNCNRRRAQQAPLRRRLIVRRPRRDINMDMLRLKTAGSKVDMKPQSKPLKSKFENNDKMEATFRRPDQTSAELLAESEEEEEEDKIPSEVFAELAQPSGQEDLGEEVVFPDMAKIIPGKSKFSFNKQGFKTKFELPSLALPKVRSLSPPVDPKPVNEEKKAKSAKFVDEFYSLEDLEDDGLNNYHNFFEHFGDALTFQKPDDDLNDKELFEWEVPTKKESKLEELIKHKIEDERKIEKTMHKLADLFDHRRTCGDESDEDVVNVSVDDYEFDENEDNSGRYKRDVKEYTSADIAFYKQLMQSNIKHMREQMIKSRLKKEPTLGLNRFSEFNPVNDSLQPNKRNALENIKIENQKKMMRNRLRSRKRTDVNKINFPKTRKLENLKRKIRTKPLTEGNNNLRKKRSDNNSVYLPSDHQIKAYEPIFRDMKEDVQEPRARYTIELLHDLEILGSAVPKASIRKRHIIEDKPDLKAMIADIGYLYNTIEKDSEFVRPFLDRESGEYDVIFPNKDQFQVIKDRGLTELKFVHKDESTGSTVRPYDPYTCPASYKDDATTEPMNPTKVAEIDEDMTITVMINDDFGKTKLESDDDKMKQEHVQVIKKKKSSMDQLDVVKGVFDQMKSLVDIVGTKVSKYLRIFQRAGNDTNIQHISRN